MHIDTQGKLERIPWGCPFCGNPEAFYRTTIEGFVMVVTVSCEACASESAEADWEEDEIIKSITAERGNRLHTTPGGHYDKQRYTHGRP